ncbi:DUF6538 domain-containing protein [Halomonas lysinitropha]|uniref:DUF6538 domain-containing protein n=1 Tax=Halomonas lysinitropha TaxID=2607506 RepID=A0A5K1ICC2_9GAMM|nr:DUF6538 domain-containing protein [Halomonas lysinitropha]VVZ97399.1 hypothetical protein HALO32_03518 [Halomonas lysinitropha]
MAYGSYLTRSRHQTTFYARIVIPHDLRQQLGGKREVRQSLRTACKVTAKRRAMQTWLAFQEFFDALRNDQSVDDLQTAHEGLAALNELLRTKNSRSNTPAASSSQKTSDHPKEPFRAMPFAQVTAAPADMPEGGLVLRYLAGTYRGQRFKADYGCPEINQAAVSRFFDDIDRRFGPPVAEQSAVPTVSISATTPIRKSFAEAANDYLEQYRRDREYDNTLRSSTYDKESRDVTFWKH